MNPAGYLRGLNAILKGSVMTNLPPPDPEKPYDPVEDSPYIAKTDMPKFFDRNGNKIGLRLFARLAEDEKYITVRAEFVRGYAISTVWTGLDMSVIPGGPPLIFETVIFAPSQGQVPSLVYGPERYASEAAALDGHDVALAWLEEQPDAPPGHAVPGIYDAMTTVVHRITQNPESRRA
jgi:hypothetical protein